MSDLHNVATKLPVIFRYPNAKGLFVDVPDFKPGGAPLMMYSFAKKLAQDDSFDIMFWVEGKVPQQRIEGVKLFAMPTLIEKGLPGFSRIENNKRKADFWDHFRNSLCIFTVADGQFYPSAQEAIHRVGGKTIYMLASDVDAQPELRFADEADPFMAALKKADGVFAQTGFQQRLLKERFSINSKIIQPAFFDCDYDAPNKDIILWVGQCVPIKRPWIIAELARRFPQEKFVMIMPEVDPNLAFSLRNDVERIANLQIVSHVDPTEIQAYYNRAKIVLNTSVYEGYPNTLHQASIGRAPYLSLSWDPDSYLEAKNMGAGANNDVLVFADTLERYLKDEKLRLRQGENAYDNFKTEHDISIVVEDLKAAIRNVAMLKS